MVEEANSGVDADSLRGDGFVVEDDGAVDGGFVRDPADARAPNSHHFGERKPPNRSFSLFTPSLCPESLR